MKNLRARVIRLAHQNPNLRSHLLPLLKQASSPYAPRTMENSKLRIQVTRSAIRATDLVNAGKRGKTCITAVLYNIDFLNDEEFSKLTPLFMDLENIRDIDDAEKRFSTMAYLTLADAPRLGYATGSVKGVEVTPYGFHPLEMNTEHLYLKSEYDTFVIRDKSDRFNEPTCMPAIRGGKADIKVFYRWVQDNKNRIADMTYSALLKEMDAQKIQYHTFCAVD